MNTIKYHVHDEDEDGGYITFTAIVEDGKASGPYETSRTYSTGSYVNVDFYLDQFLRDLAHRTQNLHLREHQG
jgi:hypothetical protein